MSNPVPILRDATAVVADPRAFARPATEQIDQPADDGACNPTVVVVDLLVCEMQRRVVLAQYAAAHLPDPSATASALRDLKMTGSRLAMMGRDPAYRASELVNCCRQLHKRLAALEEAIWRALVKTTFHADQQGDQL